MAKVKGSKIGNIINAKFQGQAKSLFPSLKKTKLVVLLSIIGNEFCCGQYLKSIIKTATSNFGFTTFLIADEVYWNNLILDFSKEEELLAKKKAHELGEEFLNKNIDVFSSKLKLTTTNYDQLKSINPEEQIKLINELANEQSNFEIVFWSDWLAKCPEYTEKRKIINSCFNEDSSLKKSVEKTAYNFATRHQDDSCSFELLMKRSSTYLIEETPGVMWVSAALGYNFVAYPGEMIKPFKTAKDFFIKDKEQVGLNDYCVYSEEPKLLANWLEITFHRSHENQTAKLDVWSNNFKDINPATSENFIPDLIHGITKGVFSLEMDYEAKVKLLVDVILEYQMRSQNYSIPNNNTVNDLLTSAKILSLEV